MPSEKYNRWTIISVASTGKHKKVLCRCDCGTEKAVRYDHIKSGRSNSCGCYLKELITNDISGLRFNKLTVISVSARNNRGETLWNCLCDCGAYSVVTTSSLVTGNTKSCGCLYRETRKALDLKSKRFGLLDVIEKESSSGAGILWKCKCDCGKYCYRTSSSLNGGGAVSCGCLKKTTNKVFPYSTESFRKRSRVSSNKRRSLKRNAEGFYTKEQIDNLLIKQKGRCANCTKVVGFDYHTDHIIPLSKGGSNDIYNIQILCNNCNLRKHAIDPIVFAHREGRLL